MYFDGVDDYCDLLDLISPTTFTLGFIIRPESAPGTLMGVH